MAAMEEQNYLWKEKQETGESIPYSQDRLVQKLNIRKKAINQKLFSTRVIPSSNEFQSQRIEEDKEELLDTGVKNYPLHQHNNYYRRKKHGKRCWVCKAWSHTKKDCPRIRCFYCGKRGHTKKKCFKRDLHQALQVLKQLGPQPHQPMKKKQTSLDRMKEIEFVKKGDEIMMKHLGQELAMHIGKYNFEWAERYFRKPILPKWKMEKVIHEDLPMVKLKISNILPHQCSECGEVCDGKEFLYHLQIKHRSICPAGSLINAWPHRFWLLWYDDKNYIKFMETRGNPNYIRAKPPWLTEEAY